MPDQAPILALPSLKTVRLSAMMWLQYFIWGAWFITLGSYMNEGLGFGEIIGLTYATQGIAAMIAPLFVGVIADRWLSAQKLMGLLNLAGGGFLLAASLIDNNKGLFVSTILFCLICYMPTIALSNAIAFNTMATPEKAFPRIRVFGSLGWICAGLSLAVFNDIAATAWPLRLAAAVSGLAGLYAFTLPDTPPQAAKEKINIKAVFGLDLLHKVRDGRYLAFMTCSLLIVIPLSFYYAYANRFLVDISATVTLGGLLLGPSAVQVLSQTAEAACLLLVAYLFCKTGGFKLIFIGMAAWAISYALLIGGAVSGRDVLMWVIPAILLQGLCYDFVFIVGQMEVDDRFETSERSRAQSFHAFITFGVGNVLGYVLSGLIYSLTVAVNGADGWALFWTVPAVLALGVTMLYGVLRQMIRSNPRTA